MLEGDISETQHQNAEMHVSMDTVEKQLAELRKLMNMMTATIGEIK